MSALLHLLDTFRTIAQTEREKGSYFEQLVQLYLRYEPKYQQLYQSVWLWQAWRDHQIAQGEPDPGNDTGIDLVACTHAGDYHAIQAKFWDRDRVLYKKDVDSFFTASGRRPFVHRLLVFSTNHISTNLQEALRQQTTPVITLTLADLEASKIDWQQISDWNAPRPVLKAGKQLRPYQQQTIDKVTAGLQQADRGKLIMACGTGKTFTALRLAEQLAGAGGRVLFLVPSLNLLSQTLTEWTQEATVPLHCYAVCSDHDIGKKRLKQDDFELQVHELHYPATTDAGPLARAVSTRHDGQSMTVIFSTYHSIETLSRAQQQHSLPPFDLIIADEAHRTTGSTFEGSDESTFVKVHDPAFIQAGKRLYMTATPRVYGLQARVKAEQESIALYSMDNPAHFGETLHSITFSEAVHHLKVLCDYKVIILTISAEHISQSLQQLLADEENSLRVDDAAKLVGCWRAMAKIDSQHDFRFDPAPMRRAVAFAQVIDVNHKARVHKVSSKQIAALFQKVAASYRAELLKDNPDLADTLTDLACQARHVDGGMGALEKNAALDWLKEALPDNVCRILSNVRCLSEGVDIPALDAVLFLTPRDSQVEVVQSVGRVMRRDPQGHKKLGYVILPVVIPAGVSPEEALNDNKSYRVVWEVLQALRSHDDRFDAMINKLDLSGSDPTRMEVIAISHNVLKSSRSRPQGQQRLTSHNLGRSHRPAANTDAADQPELDLPFEVGEIERAILAKVVQKCGNRLYWDEWAGDIARIAQTHIARIRAIVDTPTNQAAIAAFEGFLRELQADLNDSITRAEAIEMLAQHLITRPVFDALFEGYQFTRHNPVSLAMQQVLDVLESAHLAPETETLTQFYHSVRLRAAGITDLRARQRIIVELYDKFFRNAFPRLVERLGIVYTPVEVVDFILHSVNDALKMAFGQTLADRNVHILDPFTGTGTFITRLLQSGLINHDQLAYKYQHEIHANEIVLLAYYIAAINIEQVYHGLVGGDYLSFSGICLTDTFALYQKRDLVSDQVADNSRRRKRQQQQIIQVIIGNPPYSAGQTSGNDNNANLKYPALDDRIAETYVAHSTAINKNALYDSYIRALRWASDRIGPSGVIGFVSNAGFIEANTADGLRKCLAEEFSSLYIFHLRGNQRTSGELSRREGGKIFGSGSRAPIAITILIKNPQSSQHGQIHFHDIGDYLNQEEKLAKIEAFKSIQGITAAQGWRTITPDSHHDWINQRDDSFADHISLGDKRDKSSIVLFENYSSGVKTNRDAWCYNASKRALASNMQRLTEFYNAEVARYQSACIGLEKDHYPDLDQFISTDDTKISWSSGLRNDLTRQVQHPYDKDSLVVGLYRPFSKSNLYFGRSYNERAYQMPQIFPDGSAENLVIALVGLGTPKAFSALMTDVIPDIQLQANGQCFPLKLYQKNTREPVVATGGPPTLFDDEPSPEGGERYSVRDGITDAGLRHFQQAYPQENISKEDLFYYIYGLLHSEEYKQRYADNLTKELPRIPRVGSAADFWAFATAGRALAQLHVHYEAVEPWPVQFDNGAGLLEQGTPEQLRVQQMRFAKGSEGEKQDKTRVIYNSFITVSGIPLEAYRYVVNGKPAIEWVMERQAVVTHKDSGIVNDANLWALETMNDPAYPLKLLLRVITVSMKTLEIVAGLPRMQG
ncbi:MAG: DEAD/DEAH box helicase [Magnetococcales bacterium]|nr:DEAD/DEAH box helicase [Magnetococcales bacterium]